MERVIIIDQKRNQMFHGKDFKNFDEGWEFLSENVDNPTDFYIVSKSSIGM